MRGPDILEKVRDTYLAFETYSDVGTAHIVPPIGIGTPTEFKTYFSRPDKVRFSWRDWHPYFGRSKPPSNSMIWTDGQDSRIRSLRGTEYTETFSIAIAGATGVSSAAAVMILLLLRPGSIGFNYKWYQMKTIGDLDEEDVAGTLCYHLSGCAVAEGDTEVWIDKGNFLVRRLRWYQKPEQYIEYDYLQVATNKPLPDDLFVGSKNEVW